MQIKGMSKQGTRSDSLLPSAFGESCEGRETFCTCYHVHVNHYPGGTQSTEQRACCSDETLPEKSLLTGVPLDSEQLAVEFIREAPPPYHGNPGQEQIWTTKTSRRHPRKPSRKPIIRIEIVILRSLLTISTIMMGYSMWYRTVPDLLRNYDMARKLHRFQIEALQTVNSVEDINNIPAEYEGKLIHVTGLLSVDTPVTYEECGISVRSVKVNRLYDLSYTFVRSGSEPFFTSHKGLNVRLGDEHFCKSPICEDPDEKIADIARIGPLVLGHRIKEKFDEYYLRTEKLRELSTNRAFRVMFSDAGRNGQKYSILGQLVNGTIEPYDFLDYYIIILQRESEVSAEKMILDRVHDRLWRMDVENVWLWGTLVVGLLVPLTTAYHYVRFVIRPLKNKRNPVMLGMSADKLAHL